MLESWGLGLASSHRLLIGSGQIQNASLRLTVRRGGAYVDEMIGEVLKVRAIAVWASAPTYGAVALGVTRVLVPTQGPFLLQFTSLLSHDFLMSYLDKSKTP